MNPLVGALLLVLIGSPVAAQVRYVDEKGIAHWVSSFDQVPERHREQVLERQLADNSFFEPISRPRRPEKSPPLQWELIQRDFEDRGKRLTRKVLRGGLSVTECRGLMQTSAAHDPYTEKGKLIKAKSGQGIAVIHRGYRDALVRVWQCVEQQ